MPKAQSKQDPVASAMSDACRDKIQQSGKLLLALATHAHCNSTGAVPIRDYNTTNFDVFHSFLRAYKASLPPTLKICLKSNLWLAASNYLPAVQHARTSTPLDTGKQARLLVPLPWCTQARESRRKDWRPMMAWDLVQSATRRSAAHSRAGTAHSSMG